MGNILTKNKITINIIIEFVHKAMVFNLPVYSRYGADYGFDIENGENMLTILIKLNKIEIFTEQNGFIVVQNSLTDRDKLDLEALKLDIKEYNEEKALNIFNNFFADTIDKPTSVDDLNDDDE